MKMTPDFNRKIAITSLNHARRRKHRTAGYCDQRQMVS